MSEIQTHRGVHRFAIATAASTVLLLMAGALVTGNDAADSVPDWPLAYGRIIPPLVGGIRYEFAHRVVAGLVAVLTLTLAIIIWRSKLRGPARRWGWIAVLLVAAQAALGGMRVLLGHPAVIATGHATLAQIFFITVVSLTLFTSAWWQREPTLLNDPASPRLRSMSLWTTAALFVQIIFGAGFRHGAFGILPHLFGFVVVTWLVMWTCGTVRRRFGEVRDLRRWAVLLQAFFGTQILLGIAAYWAVAESLKVTQPMLLYVAITTAHLLVGALTLASSVLLTLSCFRMIRPVASVAVGSQSERARA